MLCLLSVISPTCHIRKHGVSRVIRLNLLHYRAPRDGILVYLALQNQYTLYKLLRSITLSVNCSVHEHRELDTDMQEYVLHCVERC
jgi:hypothetical protein